MNRQQLEDKIIDLVRQREYLNDELVGINYELEDLYNELDALDE